MRRRGVHCNVRGDKIAYCLQYIECKQRPKIEPLSDDAVRWPQCTASMIRDVIAFAQFADAFDQLRVEGVHLDSAEELRASHALGVLGLIYGLRFNIVCVNLGTLDGADLYRAYTPTEDCVRAAVKDAADGDDETNERANDGCIRAVDDNADNGADSTRATSDGDSL